MTHSQMIQMSILSIVIVTSCKPPKRQTFQILNHLSSVRNFERVEQCQKPISLLFILGSYRHIFQGSLFGALFEYETAVAPFLNSGGAEGSAAFEGQ